MLALEKLTLSLPVVNRSTFIDGIHLNNEIRDRMPHLSTFIFNIITHNVDFPSEDDQPSSDDIRRTFLQGISADCYVDYSWHGQGRCHVYSVPYLLTRFHGITNNFPGSQFTHVRSLFVLDGTRPFEHEFFQRIAPSFPLLKRMVVINQLEQIRSKQLVDHEQASSMVEYSHLTELDLDNSHVDYVKQFLIDRRIYLPRLNTLCIRYEHLTMVTENFTNNATRLNCAKVKRLLTEDKIVHSEAVYLYFPSL